MIEFDNQKFTRQQVGLNGQCVPTTPELFGYSSFIGTKRIPLFSFSGPITLNPSLLYMFTALGDEFTVISAIEGINTYKILTPICNDVRNLTPFLESRDRIRER